MTCNSEVATANTSNNTKLIISAQQAGKMTTKKLNKMYINKKLLECHTATFSILDM